MSELDTSQRKALKARAHSLNSILQLGEKGLTDAVIAEIHRALAAHELIKIRAAPLNRAEREVALASICERTGAEAVQHIGKILVLYREKPETVQEPKSTPPPQRSTPPRGSDRRAKHGSPERRRPDRPERTQRSRARRSRP